MGLVQSKKKSWGVRIKTAWNALLKKLTVTVNPFSNIRMYVDGSAKGVSVGLMSMVDSAEINGYDKDRIVGSRKWAMHHATLGSLMVNSELNVKCLEFNHIESAMVAAQIFCRITDTDIKEIACIYRPQVAMKMKQQGYYAKSMGHQPQIQEATFDYCKGALAFKPELYDRFVVWFAEYAKRFEGLPHDITPVPLMVIGEQISGIFQPSAGEVSLIREDSRNDGWGIVTPDDDMFEEWGWIVENTTSRVTAYEGLWLFEDPKEALLFNLQKQ